MLIKVGNFECTEVWDGVFYKKLSNYPQVSDWEIKTLIEFIEYEKKYGRDCTIECEDDNLLNLINQKISNRELHLKTSRPQLLTECTACPYRKGCVTDYVCHTTSLENAIKIFECGKLLSALNARKISVEELMQENRNAANDPADYFEYIMFAWGNCQAGDRLVMERQLKRFPNEEDLSVCFNPGVRFYFKYDQLINHPNTICDGVLPMKVKDEIILSDWVYKIVIPTKLKDKLERYIPNDLKDRILYIQNDCKDIWDWSEKVYGIIEKNLEEKMSTTIRRMTIEDKSIVMEMMRVFYASPAVLSNGSEEIFENDIENCVNDSPYLEGFIFEDGKEIQGYGIIAKSFSTEFGKPCIWIEDLYIKPDYRGLGIGSMFFDYLKETYTDCIFRLEVEEENERAIHVYEKNGFEVLPYMEMKQGDGK